MKTFNLEPVNNRKSFYNKCKVETEGDISTLISYTTKVATYNHKTNKMVVKAWYSSTTATHINSFLVYFGFETCSKKEMENYND